MDIKGSLASTYSLHEEKELSSLFNNSTTPDVTHIKRDDFDKDFVFGVSGAAYQFEGGAAEGGRGSSIWDDFTLNQPEKIEDGSNGNVTCYQYKMYKEDIKALKKTGLNAYRFSISWSRILPGGKLSAGVNPDGLKYYNDLIDTILAAGLEPYVTLFHWDLPLALEHDYGGFLSRRIVKDFRNFAELCFWEFGDRVKHWITTNEAWTFTYKGYVTASFPPGRGTPTPPTTKSMNLRVGYKNSWKVFPSAHGNPGTEPYIVAHHILLAHAAVVALYRNQFQGYQGGEIGMTNNVNMYEPLDEKSAEDKSAAVRAIDFMFGWFVAPLVTGDYPQSMRERVGTRLPVFTPPEAKLVKGSYDFLGVNYYTTYYATKDTSPPPPNPSYIYDEGVTATPFRNGVPIGKQAGSDWLYIVPRGIYEFLMFAKEHYADPLIYITENGVDEKNNCHYTVEQAQHDYVRVKYHHDHLVYLLKAIKEGGVNVKAYFLWSLFDNFEWNEGYTVRFGIFFINFANGLLTRYPKRSAIWWANFMGAKFERNSLKRQTTQIEGKTKNQKSISNA